MSERAEFTLTPKTATDLAAELLTRRVAPGHIDELLNLPSEQFDAGDRCVRRYRPDDVIAWCRERQSPRIRRALAMADMVDELGAGPDWIWPGVDPNVVVWVADKILAAGDAAVEGQEP